jgi:hypothetical protein
MTFDVMVALRESARACPQRIVFPESKEENILRAARQVRDREVGLPILLGDPGELAEVAAGFGVGLDGIEVLDVSDDAVMAELSKSATLCSPRSPSRAPSAGSAPTSTLARFWSQPVGRTPWWPVSRTRPRMSSSPA